MCWVPPRSLIWRYILMITRFTGRLVKTDDTPASPRPLLLAQQGYGLLLRGWGSLDNWYKNYEYQQNVMKSQEGVPVEPDA